MTTPHTGQWSIRRCGRYEFTFYMVVALLGMTRLLRPWGVLALIALSVALPVVGHLPYRWAEGFDLFKHFGAGMVFYLLRDRIPLRGWLAGVSALTLAATVFTGLFNTAFALFGSYLIMWLAFTPKLPHINATRWGDLSYGIYILAWPLQQTLMQFFPQMTWWENFLVAFALTVPLAYASWHLIEKRALQLKRRALQAVAA